MPPKKQGGKKNKDDDWDDGALERKMAALKAAEEKEKEVAAWDEESDEEPAPPPKPKGKAAFAMLMDDSDDDKSESEPEEKEEKKVEVKREAKPQPKKAEKPAEPKADNKKKGKKGKKGKQNDEDDELDAILANLEKPKEKPEPKAEKPASESPAPEPSEEKAPEEAGDQEEGKDKKKKKKKKDKKKGDDAAEEAAPEEAVDQDEEKGEDDEEEGEGGAKDKKKKKKKDKKKNKDKDEDDGKPKKKKHVDMIKELLRAKKEAEDAEAQRLKEEQERVDELNRQAEEEARLAQEKRDAEKERKKAAIQKKKDEGTYMTAKEKEKARIAAAKLAAAGITLPARDSTETTEKKPVIYMDKRALKKKQKLEEKQAAEKSASPAPSAASSTEAAPTSADSKPREEESPKEDEPIDDWELADVDDIKVPEAAPVATAPASTSSAAKTVAKQESQDAEESSEESSSDDDSDDESSEESSDEEDQAKGKETKEQVIERVKARLKKRRESAEAKRTTDNLRSPVICVLGHVDTGKTKMLDTIRRTHVQEGEAGGITQQIGATAVPAEAIKERCKLIRDFDPETMKLPGFLIIDTPGHESFTNLRSRGSSLCDYAILVVDLMHGLEQQTIESLKMLAKRGTPFVVALNKIDRLYGYSSNPRKDVYQHLKSQPQNTQLEFQEKMRVVVGQFSEQGFNVCLGIDNKDPDEYISMIPTSAMLGDGIGNLMSHIVNAAQGPQAQKLSFTEELDASVMEVKVLPGLGTTVDIILVNGYLKVGDILVLTGTDGAIMTPIRELLMPQPLREIRVKTDFQHFKEVKGAQGVKVLAKGLEKTVAGLPVYVAHNADEIDILKDEAEAQLSKALMAIKKKPEGVYVMASTLGSLEALLEFLKSQKIPYSNVNIGPVHKRDVQKAAAMKEHKAEYACILAFDVRVERDAQLFADHEGVRIFQADIIYHLEDNFLKYREDIRLQARKENEHKAIFPCKLRIMPQHVFNARNPIVVGVSIEAGQCKRGTPICVPSKDGIFLGAISSIQRNHEEVPLAKKGEEVCVKIENTTGEAPKLYGRHFNHEDTLVSMITRDSIDVCKTYFRDDLAKEDWQLIVELKKVLDIM